MFDLDKWKEIWATLRSNKLRTFLTAFGVVWGIFMLMAMLAFGSSMQSGMTRQMKGMATNMLFVWGGQTTEAYEGMQPGRLVRYNTDDIELLRQLPGIGPYTAGAIATFAFEQSTPAVDTNVERVIRRAFHPRLGRGAQASARIWRTAAALVPGRGSSAWAFNQAIMELGALICTAREARCAECPVARSCSTGKVAMRRRGRVPPPRARGARARR